MLPGATWAALLPHYHFPWAASLEFDVCALVKALLQLPKHTHKNAAPSINPFGNKS